MIDSIEDKFYANSFLYVLQKKSINDLCLESHGKYVLFRTFFSQVNNKPIFFSSGTKYVQQDLNTPRRPDAVNGDAPML